MATYHNLEDFFSNFKHKITAEVPVIIAETAQADFRENFQKKSFDGIAWKETKKTVQRGTLMVRSGQLLNSIRPELVTAGLVRISAGNSKVPYARVHNEGEKISRFERSETFTRNRTKSGKNKGKFSKGTLPGKGYSYKEHSYTMTKRQFMGRTKDLDAKIIRRIKSLFNS